MPDNAPVITSRGEAVSRTTLNRSALAALACGALLAGCVQQPESGTTAQAPRSFLQVATVEGDIRGIAGDGLVEYKGIPYAGLVAGSGSRPVNHGGNLARLGVWPVYDRGDAARLPLMIGATDSEFTMGPPEAQRAVSEQMMRYCTNFARSGDPNGEGLPQWPAYQNQNTLYFTPDGVESRNDS